MSKTANGRRTRMGTTTASVVVAASLGLLGTGVATAAPVQTSTSVPTPAVAAIERALGPVQQALGDSVDVKSIRATDNPDVSVVDWTVDVDQVNKALGINKRSSDANSLLMSTLPTGVDLSKVNIDRILDGKTVPSAVTELSKVGKGTKNSAIVGQLPTVEGMKNPELAKKWSDVIKNLDGNDVVSSIHSAAQSLGVDDADGAVTELANRLGTIPDLLGKSPEQILALVDDSDKRAPVTRPAALVDTEGADQVKFSAPINTKATGIESAFGDALRTGADGAAREIDRDRARNQVSEELSRQVTPFAGELGDARDRGLIPNKASDLGLPKEILDIKIPVIDKTVGQVLDEVLDLVNGVVDGVTGGNKPADPTKPGQGSNNGQNQDEAEKSPLDDMSFNEAMEVYDAVNTALKEQNNKDNPSQGSNSGNSNQSGDFNNGGSNSGNNGGNTTDGNTTNGSTTGGNGGNNSGGGSASAESNGNGVSSNTDAGSGNVTPAGNSSQTRGTTQAGSNGSPNTANASNASVPKANGDGEIPPPTYNNAAAGSLPVTGASSSTPWIAGIAALAILAGVAAAVRSRSLKS